MARRTHALQIDLCFCDLACEHLNVSARVRLRDLTCKSLNVFTERLVSLNRQTQPMAECVSRRAGTAVKSVGAGANPSICAVGLNLAFARQAAGFSFGCVVSIALNSSASTSCTLRCKPCPCIPLHAHTSSSGKIRRCCVDRLNPPPKADIQRFIQSPRRRSCFGVRREK